MTLIFPIRNRFSATFPAVEIEDLPEFESSPDSRLVTHLNRCLKLRGPVEKSVNFIVTRLVDCSKNIPKNRFAEMFSKVMWNLKTDQKCDYLTENYLEQIRSAALISLHPLCVLMRGQ